MKEYPLDFLRPLDNNMLMGNANDGSGKIKTDGLQYFMNSLICNKDLLTSHALRLFARMDTENFEKEKSKYLKNPSSIKVRIPIKLLYFFLEIFYVVIV